MCRALESTKRWFLCSLARSQVVVWSVLVWSAFGRFVPRLSQEVGHLSARYILMMDQSNAGRAGIFA
eukprot:571936-Prorocentrum_minimum.AAC.1